jgi:integrase
MARIIRYPKPNGRETAPLGLVSQEDMAQLFTALAAEPLQSQVFFLLCAVAGLRHPEATQLKWAHLDLDMRTWKGRAGNALRLPAIIHKRLKQLRPIGEGVFHAERYAGSTWAPGGAALYWSRIYDRAHLPTIRMEAIRLTWQEWERTDDPVMAWLDDMLDRMTSDQLLSHAPPLPNVGVRSPVLFKRRPHGVTRQVVSAINPGLEWPGQDKHRPY